MVDNQIKARPVVQAPTLSNGLAPGAGLPGGRARRHDTEAAGRLFQPAAWVMPYRCVSKAMCPAVSESIQIDRFGLHWTALIRNRRHEHGHPMTQPRCARRSREENRILGPNQALADGFVQGEMARPTRFERVTFAFGGQRSIQLSYGRKPWSVDSRSQRARQCGICDRARAGRQSSRAHAGSGRAAAVRARAAAKLRRL